MKFPQINSINFKGIKKVLLKKCKKTQPNDIENGNDLTFRQLQRSNETDLD